jgi:hypothetical protein
MIEFTPEQIQTLIAAIIALITAIMAILKNNEAKDEKENALVAEAQVAAYNVDSVESMKPEIVATLSERSWKMSDATRRWLTFDATPENYVKINQVIDGAEAAHLVSYQIVYNGGYYNIEYGLLKGGAGNPSGKKIS